MFLSVLFVHGFIKHANSCIINKVEKSFNSKIVERILKVVGAKRIYELPHYLELQQKRNAKHVRPPIVQSKLWQEKTLQNFCYYECAGNNTVVFYTHGGAFVSGPNLFHWRFLKNLHEQTGATIIFPIYPKAPAFSHKHAFDFLIELCKKLATEHVGKNIVFAGDSAGGNIALALACQLKDQNIGFVPQKLVLISPCLDLTLSNPEIDKLEQNNVDPMLSKKGLATMYAQWAKDTALENPVLSPINANLQGLGKIALFIGTNEILLPENLAFADIAKQQGVEVELFVGNNQNHAWVLHPIEEAKQPFETIKQFINN